MLPALARRTARQAMAVCRAQPRQQATVMTARPQVFRGLSTTTTGNGGNDDNDNDDKVVDDVEFTGSDENEEYFSEEDEVVDGETKPFDENELFERLGMAPEKLIGDENDPEDWLGYKGDVEAVDEHGTPLWLRALRADVSAPKTVPWWQVKNKDDEKRVKLGAAPPKERVQELDEFGRAYGTGRRKTSNARVWISYNEQNLGTIRVNKMEMSDYFKNEPDMMAIIAPFVELGNLGSFDVRANVRGGGTTGQAGAIRHGISRALEKYDPSFRTELKSAGFMTRDPRMVERKKAGRAKARKSFQWVKR